MKKGSLTLLIGLLMFLLASGCGKKEEQVQVQFGFIEGLPTMGMLRLMEETDYEGLEKGIDFTVAASPEELTQKLFNGELDIALMPAEKAAALYNNSDGEFQLAAANVQNALYILEKGDETISRIWHLEGKNVYAAGKGTAAEEILNCLLSEAGLDPKADTLIQWVENEEEVLSRLEENEYAVALLPEPFATEAQEKTKGLHAALDLSAVWESMGVGGRLTSSGLLVREDSRHFVTKIRIL